VSFIVFLGGIDFLGSNVLLGVNIFLQQKLYEDKIWFLQQVLHVMSFCCMAEILDFLLSLK
jgi:hypothetical protein